MISIHVKDLHLTNASIDGSFYMETLSLNSLCAFLHLLNVSLAFCWFKMYQL